MQQRDNFMSDIVLPCVAPYSQETQWLETRSSHVHFNVKRIKDEHSVAEAQMPDKLWSRTINTRAEPRFMLNFPVSPVLGVFYPDFFL